MAPSNNGPINSNIENLHVRYCSPTPSQENQSRINISPSESPISSPNGESSPSSIVELGSVIGSRSLIEFAACPCCKQSLDDSTHQTLSTPPLPDISGGTLMRSFDFDDEDSPLQGVVEEGVAYMPTRVLVEGWVHKKGTGQDWLGSQSWKARWARLVMARVDDHSVSRPVDYEVDIPLLMIYWYSTSASPSTIIPLESTVVLPFDAPEKDSWDSYQFEIRPAKTTATGNKSINQITRTFTVPQKARDTWVYAISQALLKYEKENAKARKVAADNARRRSRLIMGLERPRSPPTYDEVWSGDRFLPTGASSPPLSPNGRRKIRSPISSPPCSPPLSPPLSPRNVTKQLPEKHSIAG